MPPQYPSTGEPGCLQPGGDGNRGDTAGLCGMDRGKPSLPGPNVQGRGARKVGWGVIASLGMARDPCSLWSKTWERGQGWLHPGSCRRGQGWRAQQPAACWGKQKPFAALIYYLDGNRDGKNNIPECLSPCNPCGPQHPSLPVGTRAAGPGRCVPCALIPCPQLVGRGSRRNAGDGHGGCGAPGELS